MTSNPKTGSVGLATQIKSNGVFCWLAPNGAKQSSVPPEDIPASEAFDLKRTYVLEGCMIANLKPSDADMTVGNNIVTLSLNMQIDRYYPADPKDLYIDLHV